jgi:hypothetical protein
MLLEDLNTGSVLDGNELEFFVDEDTLIGEVYLDGELIFQEMDILNERQLRMTFFQNWTELNTDTEFEYA